MKKIFLVTKASGLVLLPIILVILPASFFDNGQSICLSVLLLHQKCFACGITRAVQHLIHLDFSQAWQYNKLSVVVTPLLIYLLIEELIRTRKQYQKLKLKDTAERK